MRIAILILAGFAIVGAGCGSRAARSSDDIRICRMFVLDARMRMEDLGRDTFVPGDLTFTQLRLLTPRDPDWRDAQFFVLNTPWKHSEEEKQIVIFCGQSRVIESERVYCVGYSSGEVAWLREEEFAGLEMRDFSVLPKIRP